MHKLILYVQCSRLYVEYYCVSFPLNLNDLNSLFPFPALQLTDKHKVTTPVNWIPGGDVIVHPSVKTEDARKIYPNVVEHKVSVLRHGHWQRMLTGLMLALPQDNIAACIKGYMKEVELWNPVSLYCSCLSMTTRAFVRPGQ